MSDQSAPQVRVIWPPEDSLNSQEYFDIVGVTFDSSGIVDVEVTLTIPTFGQVADNERQSWQKAEQYKGSYGIWTSRVTVGDKKFSRILARAKDGAGNYGYYDKYIKFPPDPPPDVIPWDKLIGANYSNPVLVRNESSTKPTDINIAHMDKYIGAAKNIGCNMLRIVVDWEAYAGNETVFLACLEEIVKRCKAAAIWVWIDFHHFFCSSWIAVGGDGFPKYIVQNFIPATKLTHGAATTNTYEQATSTAANFWKAYYTNSIVVNGKSVWDHQADFMRAMAKRIDAYTNVIGYEILNEPHIGTDDNTQYVQCGNALTYIGNQLRNDTDKYIIWTRETIHFGGSWQPVQRIEMMPRLTYHSDRIWWTPHNYAPPSSTRGVTALAQYKNTYEQVKQKGIVMPIMAWGETATQDDQISLAILNDPVLGYNIMKEFVQYAHDNKIILVYWQLTGSNGVGNKLVEADGTLTVFGQRYKQAIKEVYG